MVRAQKAHVLCSKKRANYALLVGALVSISFTVCNSVFLEPQAIEDEESGLGFLTYDCIYISETVDWYFSLLDLCQLTLFFCIIICGNVVIVYGISCKKQDIDNLRTTQPIPNLERQVAFTALSISCMYLIPTVLHLFIFLGYAFKLFGEGELIAARLGIIDGILQIYVMCMFSFGHFVCYSITGSRFRREMKEKLRCLKCSPMMTARVMP